MPYCTRVIALIGLRTIKLIFYVDNDLESQIYKY